jgi:restriction system protein
MTFLDAAYEILKQAGQPLHYADIASHALAAGLLDTRGQTPEATMGSRLYVDTKRPGSRFRRVSRGVFALAQAQLSDIGQRITDLNRRARAELRKRLLAMPPDRFEALIGELLIAIGFDEATVHITSHSGDGGIDVRGLLRAGGVTDVNGRPGQALEAQRPGPHGTRPAWLPHRPRAGHPRHHQRLFQRRSQGGRRAGQDSHRPGGWRATT